MIGPETGRTSREIIDTVRRFTGQQAPEGTGATLALAAKAPAIALGVTLVLVGQRDNERT